MSKPKLHIILCDDDISLSSVLSEYLSNADFIVESVHSGEEALERIHASYHDLCLLDINMPGMSGFEVLSQLRKSENDIPVIMLSARQAREDIMRAFQLGCDDYVTKPFSMDILICRIQAVVRRYKASSESAATSFMLGSVTFDSVRQTIGDRHLSSRESDLLLMLCRHMNQVVDRHLILCTLWQTDDYFSSRSLSVYVNHLRGHLQNTGYSIIGVHGKGYKLIEE